VHLGCVFYGDHVFALQPSEAELGNGGRGVGQQSRFICWIDPCTCNNLGTIAGSDAMLVGVDQDIQGSLVYQALLDEEGLECGHSQGQL